MNKKSYPSKFDKLVRIRRNQLLWLKKNKPKEFKTVAGYLDAIINQHKITKNL